MSVGVDLHKGQFTVYWRSRDGLLERSDRFLTNERGMTRFEAALLKLIGSGESVKVGVESTGNTRYFKRRLENVGVPVVVINTSKFKVITESVKKTDRHDAKLIAEFLEKDMLPEARLCSSASEELRRLIRTRTILVRSVVAIKNQLHGLLLSLGIEVARGSLQSQKERRRAVTMLAENGLPIEAVNPLVETIDRLQSDIRNYEKLISRLMAEDRVVQLVMTIPGAGLVTAATIRAYVDDIGRFATYKQLSAFAGLAPWVQDSNEHERHGSITKRGPTELRTALVQVVLGMVRLSRRTKTYQIMQRYAVLKQHKGSGKAIIATARKLSKILWYMLRNDEPFDPRRMTDPKIRQLAKEMSAARISAA